MADTADIVKASRWRLPQALAKLGSPTPNESLNIQKAEDGIELAKLAAKRWRHYVTTASAAVSVQQLTHLIQANPVGEYCFFLSLSADWFPGQILGEVMLRRTWCHHLFMDFLYVHPSIAGQISNVRKGIGYGLLTCVAATARMLEIPLVWGEATETSSIWYTKQFCKPGDEPVKDHFFMSKALISQFADRFWENHAMSRLKTDGG